MRSFTDMRKTAKDKREEMSSPIIDTADYPYGLSISLCDADLEKLDLDEDVEAGDMIHLAAFAKVTCVSSREVNGETERRIELQITHLSVEDENAEDEDDA